MTTKIEYTPLSGGLDLVSGAMNVKAGRMAECLNFEQVFGRQGYRRIDGYERFDGRPEPHKARYSVVTFKLGTAAIATGNIATSGAASCLVLQVNLLSGSWGAGTAAGELVVSMTAGSFANGNVLSVGGAAKATVDGAVVDGSLVHAQDGVYQALASNARRAVITQVPGSGPVLGVTVYRGVVYAARNAADGLTAALYKSSATGWQLVKDKLLPGGAWQFQVANFSGDTKSLHLFGVDGKNRPWRWDGATFTPMAAIQGTEGTSASSVGIGIGTKTFNVVEPSRAWTAGQDVRVFSAANPANQMRGAVSSYAAGVLTVAVVAVGGSGTFTDWVIGLEDGSDKPYLIAEHGDRMFLAYQRGQLQASNLGDPMVYTTTAALFGLGDEITGMTSLRGSTLCITCSNSVYLLSGSSAADWNRERYSKSAGAKLGTLQESGGNALFLDDRGLTSLQATQNYGDFEVAIFSRDIKPLLDVKAGSITASRMVKSKFQYRMYGAGGDLLTAAILTPNAQVQPSDVAFTQQKYAHSVACVGGGELDDGTDGLFFGTSDGYVMREDVGPSFDGASIDAVVRLHFNHLKSPANKKRFRKLDIEMEARKSVALKYQMQFDYADGVYAPALTSPSQISNVIAQGGGGAWNAANWDEFLWSMPLISHGEVNIDGVGRNVSFLIWHESATDLAFSMQGLMLQYSVLGLAR